MKYAVSLPKLEMEKTSLKLGDDFLMEINKKFTNFLNLNYADAWLRIIYHKTQHSISIDFESIENLSNKILINIRVQVDFYYKRKKFMQQQSQMKISELEPKCAQEFKFQVFKQLKKNIDIRKVKLIITLIGKIREHSPTTYNEYLVLTSKSSNDEQILGGAILKLKYYLNQIADT